MASEPGPRKRLQERGARALDSEAKASTVTLPLPASAAARATRSRSSSETAGPRIASESTFASSLKSAPPRDAPSTPSATRVRPWMR
jgi:hypothetical protein